MEKLNEKEQATYDYIESCIKEGMPPSNQEIADRFDLWPSGANNRLKILEEKGWIRTNGKARGIFLTGMNNED